MDHAEILASHYLTAFELASAGGVQAERARTKAIRFLVLSGNKTIGIDAETSGFHISLIVDVAQSGA